jgi:hypothetical protein
VPWRPENERRLRERLGDLFCARELGLLGALASRPGGLGVGERPLRTSWATVGGLHRRVGLGREFWPRKGGAGWAAQEAR